MEASKTQLYSTDVLALRFRKLYAVGTKALSLPISTPKKDRGWGPVRQFITAERPTKSETLPALIDEANALTMPMEWGFCQFFFMPWVPRK